MLNKSSGISYNTSHFIKFYLGFTHLIIFWNSTNHAYNEKFKPTLKSIYIPEKKIGKTIYYFIH